MSSGITTMSKCWSKHMPVVMRGVHRHRWDAALLHISKIEQNTPPPGDSHGPRDSGHQRRGVYILMVLFTLAFIEPSIVFPNFFLKQQLKWIIRPQPHSDHQGLGNVDVRRWASAKTTYMYQSNNTSKLILGGLGTSWFIKRLCGRQKPLSISFWSVFLWLASLWGYVSFLLDVFDK